ncbi:MarR family winged helix-turn-helix transcriptional regulator [Congregibacter sp.]|uniref:MarR family winged helix-turn-helix transcriptional regulator n=1 Tax=Congregibacter sp. TaxID=2744308 RepID=UPI003F6B6361
MADLLDDVLVSLRRILRATSIHSRKLGKSVGITAPQLMVLRAVNANDGLTATEVANAVSLSQATITAIVSKLEERGLLYRERSNVDKRRVHVSLTGAGREVLLEAPKPLQESFSRRFEALPSWEQHQLVSSLERIALMMDAEDLDAAPLLTDHPELH